MVRRLIIASNRLPVSVREEHGVLSLSRSNGGLATALASLFNEDDSLWVGWTGMRRRLTQEEITNLAFPPSLVPINLTKQEIEQYYDSFANGILWPLAHGLPPTVAFTDALWEAVLTVTRHFADAIARTALPEDIIWVHDYHLLLLPKLLRERGLKNKIGFFLHTPFAGPVTARKIPHLSDILKSLCSADLIGLQTDRDVRHFIAAAKRTGQKESSPIVKAFPIGIDFDSFDAPQNNAEVEALAKTYKARIRAKKVILSLSRLDYTKGVVSQLQAYELLLADRSLHGNVVYRLDIAPSRESMLEYRELRSEIEELVQRINKTFGNSSWQPIDYTYENLGLSEMTAWYRVADIHLNTPVADGMNLIAKEYIAARKSPGVLIISDSMGAAQQLTRALIVPPEDSRAAARALTTALTISDKERRERWKALREEVHAHQASHWAHDFLQTLTK